MSTLAGFVEPGESLEAAVRREVAEEVGVAIGDVVLSRAASRGRSRPRSCSASGPTPRPPRSRSTAPRSTTPAGSAGTALAAAIASGELVHLAVDLDLPAADRGLVRRPDRLARLRVLAPPPDAGEAPTDAHARSDPTSAAQRMLDPARRSRSAWAQARSGWRPVRPSRRSWSGASSGTGTAAGNTPYERHSSTCGWICSQIPAHQGLRQLHQVVLTDRLRDVVRPQAPEVRDLPEVLLRREVPERAVDRRLQVLDLLRGLTGGLDVRREVARVVIRGVARAGCPDARPTRPPPWCGRPAGPAPRRRRTRGS